MESTSVGEQWNRVGEYLNRLAFENDRLERELALKKAKRETQQNVGLSIEKKDRPAPKFETQEIEENYQISVNIHTSYDSLKSDLGQVLKDFDEFKTNRADLAARVAVSQAH